MMPEMMTIGCPTTDGWRCAERQADGSVVFFSIGPAERAAVREKWPDWTWVSIPRRVPRELTMGGRGPGVEFDLRGTKNAEEEEPRPASHDRVTRDMALDAGMPGIEGYRV